MAAAAILKTADFDVADEFLGGVSRIAQCFMN